MWWVRTLSVEKVGVLGLWGTFDKAALEMVAYKDFTESRKLAFGPPALFEFDALISDAAPLDVSLQRKEINMIPIKQYCFYNCYLGTFPYFHIIQSIYVTMDFLIDGQMSSFCPDHTWAVGWAFNPNNAT